MPSRKSDQRKSDVTAARFALADPVPEDNPPAETAAEVQPPSTALPVVQSEKNDKEKEKEKEKEKDLKDRDSKDAVSIEASRDPIPHFPSSSSFMNTLYGARLTQ